MRASFLNVFELGLLMKHIFLGAAALILSTAVGAETYIGGAVGPSQIDIDCHASCDNGDVGFKLYGGMSLPNSVLPSLSLEVGYIDFGKAQDSAGAFGVGASHSIEVSALTFGGALRAKFAPALSGVGRLGLAYVDGRSTYSGTAWPFGWSSSESSSEMKLYFGLGLEYALNKQWKLTGSADFTNYETGHTSGSARLLSIGAQYGF